MVDGAVPRPVRRARGAGSSVNPKEACDVWALSLDDDRQQLAIANSGFEKRDGQFSRDGR
jgi:hypothetical protein